MEKITRDQIIFRSTRNYCVALLTIVYSVAAMLGMYFLIENSWWWVMIFPIAFNVPNSILAKKTLNEIGI